MPGCHCLPPGAVEWAGRSRATAGTVQRGPCLLVPGEKVVVLRGVCVSPFRKIPYRYLTEHNYQLTYEF